jgi:hypothetical protein
MTVSVTTCAIVGGQTRGNGRQDITSSVRLPSLRGWAKLLVLLCCDRNADLPKFVGSVGIILPWCGSFKGDLIGDNMFTTDLRLQSFCAKRLADRSARVDPSKLSGGGRVVASPLSLGFSNLFRNKSLPWYALRPTFRIVSTTRKCSFSLAICCAFKFVAQFVYEKA